MKVKYFIVETVLVGDQVLRAKSLKSAEEYLEDNDISYFKVIPIKEVFDNRLGEGVEGILN